MKKRIAIGSDHRGFDVKKKLIDHLFNDVDIEWQDIGTFTDERTDYPPFAQEVARLVAEGAADLGILSCGSGIGIAVAANRYKKIYAGVVWNTQVAQMAKEDDNINILVIPADFVTFEEAIEITQAWLSSTFKKGRYQ